MKCQVEPESLSDLIEELREEGEDGVLALGDDGGRRRLERIARHVQRCHLTQSALQPVA